MTAIRPRPAVLAGLLGAVLALTGCGSGSTGASVASSAPSFSSVPTYSAAPATDPVTVPPSVLPPVTPPPSVEVPPPPGPSGPRPANGAVITKRGKSGRGELAIDNGTDQDAFVTLALDGQAKRAVYVRSQSKFTLSGVADGTYEIYVAQGGGWNKDIKKFTDSPDYFKFEETAPFETQRESNGIRYTKFSITLQPVAGGTAVTDPVDEGAIPA